MSLAEIEARVFMKGREINRFPVDLNEVASKLRLDKPLKIIPANLPANVGGFLYEGKNNYFINHNHLHPKQRQRFSIAHEIAHIVLGHEETQIHSWDYDDLQEWQANAFAAELLMPANEMYELAELHHRDIQSLLTAVQKYFDVSLSAAAQRITRLDIFKGTIILKDGYRTCFAYNSKSFSQGDLYKVTYENKLPSGKRLFILVSETYRQVQMIK